MSTFSMPSTPDTPSRRAVFEKLAQAGYITKGILYTTIGVLSLRAAIGFGGEIAGSRDAIKFIAGQPFGRILLILMAFGLFCYSAWRLVKVFIASYDDEHKLKAGAKRVGFLISASSYGTLGVFVVSLLVRAGGSSGSSTTSKWLNEMMATSWGPWALALIALGVFAAAGMQFKHAIKPELEDQIDTTDLDQKTRDMVVKIYQIGSAARGIVFGVGAFYLCRTAYYASTVEMKGSKDALQKIFSMPYGEWMLGVLSVGLFLYGLACLVKGRYRSVSALDLGSSSN